MAFADAVNMTQNGSATTTSSAGRAERRPAWAASRRRLQLQRNAHLQLQPRPGPPTSAPRDAEPAHVFHFTNGTAAPSGLFNNAFGCTTLRQRQQCSNPSPQTIQLTYATGDTSDEQS